MDRSASLLPRALSLVVVNSVCGCAAGAMRLVWCR
ncbi:MAG: BrxA/BrxB family bacilliredoxin [Flavobacteriales bacterium]|nr:BrxA/BrxB family bacilliredoxin [Flavobacteriales bacterium]